MKQVNVNFDGMTKNKISRLVTLNFLHIVEEIVQKRLYKEVTTESELAAYIQLNQSYISKLKSDENRYVSLDMISRLVNLLGANSNNFFLMNEAEKEKIIREGFTFNSGRSGNINNISDSKIGNFIQGAIVNGDNNKGSINTTLKIINGLPARDRKEMKEYFDSIINQNSGLQNEVGDLKKIIDQHKREIRKKEKELSEMSQKYISLLEKQKK